MANGKPVTDWLIFIGGFMQDRSLAGYGMCGMAHEARDRYGKLGVLVDYEPWKCDWKSTAEWIYRWSGYDSTRPNGVAEPPRIMIAAYSWGAGWGLTQLVEHLANRSLTVQVAIASDAVRHVGWQWSHFIGLSQVMAYMPWWTIEKPESIAHFEWFVQGRKRKLFRDWRNDVTWLRGHGWVDERGNEAGIKHVVPYATHTNMDDAPLFRQRVFGLADELFARRAT